MSPAKGQLWPVLLALVVMIVGAMALEALGRAHRAETLVLAVDASLSGQGMDDGIHERTGEVALTRGPPVSETHARARALARRGEFEEAFPMFDGVIAARGEDMALQAEYGYWLLVAGRARAAIEHLQAAHVFDPTDFLVRLNLGIAYRRTGDLKAAERILREVLEEAPTHRGAQLAMGAVLRRLGRHDEAIAVLERIAAYGGNQERAEAWLALGRAHVEARHWVEAERAFQDAIAWAPARADLYLGAAWAYIHSGRPEDLERARGYLDVAQVLAPDQAEVYSALGRLHQLREDEPAAEGFFVRAVRVDPDYLPARRRLLRTLLDRGDVSAARAHAEHLLDRDPMDPEHQLLAGLLHARSGTGETELAREAYERAIALSDGVYPEAWFNLGVLNRRAGDLPAAAAAYRQAMRERPDYVEAANNLGLVLVAQEDLEAARGAFDTAVTIDPGYAPAWFHLGQLYLDLNEPEAALPAFRHALLARPHHAETMLNLGVAYSRAGQVDEAIASYQRILERFPLYVRAYYNLSVVQGRAGRQAEEYDAVRAAVDLDPSHLPSLRKLARLEAERGQLGRAITLYEDALDRDPSHGPTAVDLAKVHHDAGHDEACRDLTSAVLAHDPSHRNALRLARSCG